MSLPRHILTPESEDSDSSESQCLHVWNHHGLDVKFLLKYCMLRGEAFKGEWTMGAWLPQWICEFTRVQSDGLKRWCEFRRWDLAGRSRWWGRTLGSDSPVIVFWAPWGRQLSGLPPSTMLLLLAPDLQWGQVTVDWSLWDDEPKWLTFYHGATKLTVTQGCKPHSRGLALSMAHPVCSFCTINGLRKTAKWGAEFTGAKDTGMILYQKRKRGNKLLWIHEAAKQK